MLKCKTYDQEFQSLKASMINSNALHAQLKKKLSCFLMKAEKVTKELSVSSKKEEGFGYRKCKR